MNPKTLLIAVASTIGLGGILTVVGMAASAWIQNEVKTQVDAQFLAAGIVPEPEIKIMQGDIEENADDIIRVESKAERIAQILMEN